MFDFIDLTDTQAVIPILGLCLLLCLVVARLTKFIGIPKVSGFIMLGIILGPYVTGIITHEFLEKTNYLSDLAMGLILFNIGGEFNKYLLRRLSNELIKETHIKVFLMFLISSTLFAACLFIFSGLSAANILIISIMLGIISIEAAPPTTVLVMKEYNTHGPITDAIMIHLAVVTGLTIVGSLFFTSIFQATGLWPSSVSSYQAILAMAKEVFGSIAIGVALGLLLTWLENFENKIGNFLFSILTMILFSQTLAYFLKLNVLLISLVLGFTVTQASSKGRLIHTTVRDIGSSLYAIFFVYAGTHINIAGLISENALFVIMYIVVRTLSIFVAHRYFAKRVTSNNYNTLGHCLYSHAGTAIAVAMTIQKIPHVTSAIIFQTIISSIFIFEIAGPLILKEALKRSGEVSQESLNDVQFNYGQDRRSIFKITKDFISNSLSGLRK
ncbi:transporter, CPA2 family [Bacteriovorax sp. BAL6_X]|uniref:cation:proton antiporter n=1 Tax=Bacteriovorax sp. BAL6_X TaxID=1201290 RepID=UPI000386C855|nr:cation:proton antiporter [Bacteriovorax sp. BAL6_X]EPZ51126.1 transporter, CPA2 family [Bacteriovorax sp. BAL6_X]